MSVRKNISHRSEAKTIQVKIDKIAAQGDGVGLYDQKTVYIPFSVTGDVITAKVIKEGHSTINAEIISLDHASDQRQAPVCQHFGKCGGCQLQILSPDVYQDWVKDRLGAALEHHGFDKNLVGKPQVSPLKSRRRVALKVLKTGPKLVLGFHVKGSAQIVDLQECPVTQEAITRLYKPLRALLAGILKNRTTGTVTITSSTSGLDILIDIAHSLTLDDRVALSDFAENYDVGSIHWQDAGFLDPVLIRKEAVMTFGQETVPLPPAAFIQATNEGEETLISLVKQAVKGRKRLADLFCGIGTFTLPMAADMQVLAVEGAKSAIDALQTGINRAGGAGKRLKKVVALHRDLFRRPLTAKELSAFDAVVFDPPRAGAKEQVAELAQSNVPLVVAVSCNPNTFARDARILVEGGYQLDQVTPVDQFLYSPHIEVVAVFTKECRD